MFPLPLAVTITPAGPGGALSFARPPSCGLPLTNGGLAPATPVFGACLVFTYVTARWLAESPERPFYTKGFDSFVTSTATSAAFRLERQSCRVGLAPTG